MYKMLTAVYKTAMREESKNNQIDLKYWKIAGKPERGMVWAPSNSCFTWEEDKYTCQLLGFELKILDKNQE